jgi:hypothetical protein
MVRRGDIFEQASVAIGIGACARMFQRGEALGLDRSRRSDTGTPLGASFRGGRQNEDSSGDGIRRSMRSSRGPSAEARARWR